MLCRLVQVDKRGAIDVLEGEDLKCEEICILTTKAGYARGGCVHEKTDEHIVVISGEITLILRHMGFYKQRMMKAGYSFLIPANTPHYFISETDSIVMEFGPTLAEKNTRDQEMRRIVEERNSHV